MSLLWVMVVEFGWVLIVVDVVVGVVCDVVFAVVEVGEVEAVVGVLLAFPALTLPLAVGVCA